jgi:hypothetical protein
MRWIALVVVGFVASFASGASAQQMRIGVAALAQNDVSQTRAAATQPLVVGASIVRNDQVRTGEDSRARVVFTDDTSLAIGPNAQVTMDEFVFRDGRSATEVGFALARGALRFTSGQSDSRAYRIQTPVATIGVRGTELDVQHLGGRTVVLLIRGAAVVTFGRTGQTVTLSTPGSSAVVTSAGVASGPPGAGSFAGQCNAVGGLCGSQPFSPLTRTAGLAPGAALCGR